MKENFKKIPYYIIMALLIVFPFFVLVFAFSTTNTYAWTIENGELDWDWHKQNFTTSNSKLNHVDIGLTYTDYSVSPIETVDIYFNSINIQLRDTFNDNNVYDIALDLTTIPNVSYQEINGTPRLIYNNNVDYIIDEISLNTYSSNIALNYINTLGSNGDIDFYHFYNNIDLDFNTSGILKIDDSEKYSNIIVRDWFNNNKECYYVYDTATIWWTNNHKKKFQFSLSDNRSKTIFNNIAYDEGLYNLGSVYLEVSTNNIGDLINSMLNDNWYSDDKYNELLEQYNTLQQSYNDLQIQYQTSLYPIMFGDFAYIDNITYYDSTYEYTKNLAYLVNNNYLQNNGELFISQLMEDTVDENFNTQINYVEINFIENLINARNLHYNFVDRETSSVTFAFNVNGQIRVCNIGNLDEVDYQTIKSLLSLNDNDVVYLNTILIDNVSYTSDMYDFVIESNPYDLVSYNNGLQAGLQSASQEFEKQKQALLNEISLLNDDIQNLNAQITNRDATISYYQGLISNYQTRITSLQNDINTLTSAYNSLSESYENALNGNNFVSLFFTIAETPFTAFKSIWNVDFLGVNLAGFVTGILFIGIIIWLIKKVF